MPAWGVTANTPLAAPKASPYQTQTPTSIAKLKAVGSQVPANQQVQGGHPPGTLVPVPGAAPAPVGTPAVAATPATPSTSTPVAPYLTSPQAGQEINQYGGYQAKVGAINQQLGQAPVNEGTAEANAIHANAISKEQQDSLAAAHGVFGSGVHANAITDLATNLAQRTLLLKTNLGSLVDGLNAKIDSLNYGWNSTALGFSGLAEQNAQNAPPVVTPGTPGSPGSPAAVGVNPTPPAPAASLARPTSNKTVAQSRLTPNFHKALGAPARPAEPIRSIKPGPGSYSPVQGGHPPGTR